MAFGDARGDHWLILPFSGVVILLAAWFDVTPEWVATRERALGIGFTLTVVGVILAGLIGHVIWMVPFALFLMLPFVPILILLEWIDCLTPQRRDRDQEREKQCNDE